MSVVAAAGDPATTRLCVIGDTLADTDVTGVAERLSPEAPVPVIDQRHVAHRPGGAGLAALLAAQSGAQVSLITALTDDPAGRRLQRQLVEAGVDVWTTDWRGDTVEKIRIGTNRHVLVRLDRGGGSPAELPERLLGGVRRVLHRADAVLVADYGLGMTELPSLRRLLARLGHIGTPLVWDPHPRGATPVEHAALVCPSEAEAARFEPMAEACTPMAQAVERAARLRRRWHAMAVAVTMGERGAVVSLGDGAPLAVPVLGGPATGDPCGAGDALAVAATLALGEGATIGEAVRCGVGSASRFVAAGGARGVADHAEPGRDQHPRRGTLVATGGCFDLLHPGHLRMLRAARQLGDRLVVLLNDDASIARRKWPGRPVQPVEDRREVLAGLRDVDEVIVFGEDTPVEALRRLRPDIFVKGGDYTGEQLPEAPVMAAWGGVVVTVPSVTDHSTTNIVGRARADRHQEEIDGQPEPV